MAMKMVCPKLKGIVWLAGMIVAVGAGVVVYGLQHAARTATHTEAVAEVAADDLPGVVRQGTDTVLLSADIVQKMRLKTSTTHLAERPINLPSFQGNLAIDNDRLSRVHSRFVGEVIALGHSTDGSDPPIRVGERVQRGDLLAVIWSTELGAKKSELVNALTKLDAEKSLRDRLKKLWEEGAGAGRPYRDAEKDVQARLVEIASIERTLRTWRVTEEEIAALRSEAQHLLAEDLLRTELNTWARVEIRAPMSGVILEKNVVVGDIVEPESDLFKIGDLSRLAVWAHVYEEDLPLFDSMALPAAWTVSLPSRPEMALPGMLEKVGAMIDPTQHTALLMGYVDNVKGEFKVGQFVKVAIEVAPPADELELPASAVVEDGRESVVFVQDHANGCRFFRRPVQIVRRLRDVVYVRAIQDENLAGHQVVSSGTLMLLHAMHQSPAPEANDLHSTAEGPVAAVIAR